LDQVMGLGVEIVLVVPLHVLRKYHDDLDSKRDIVWSIIVCSG
jgi:hypothetical protein